MFWYFFTIEYCGNRFGSALKELLIFWQPTFSAAYPEEATVASCYAFIPKGLYVVLGLVVDRFGLSWHGRRRIWFCGSRI